MDQTLRNEAGYEEYELDASNKDFAIVALDLLSGLGTVMITVLSIDFQLYHTFSYSMIRALLITDKKPRDLEKLSNHSLKIRIFCN